MGALPWLCADTCSRQPKAFLERAERLVPQISYRLKQLRYFLVFDAYMNKARRRDWDVHVGRFDQTYFYQDVSNVISALRFLFPSASLPPMLAMWPNNATAPRMAIPRAAAYGSRPRGKCLGFRYKKARRRDNSPMELATRN